MRKIIIESQNFTKKDFINSRNGQSLQDYDGDALKVTAFAVMEDTEESGQTKIIGVLITDQGVMTTVSANVIDSIRDMKELEGDGYTDFTVRVSKRKSKQGRDFLCITID